MGRQDITLRSKGSRFIEISMPSDMLSKWSPSQSRNEQFCQGSRLQIGHSGLTPVD